MNTNQLAKDNSIALVAGVVVLGGLAYGGYKLFQYLKDFNKDTAFEGAGIAGTLGHVTDAALGGVPSAVGETVAGALYDWIHPVDNDENIFYPATIIGAPLVRPDGLSLTKLSIRGDELDGGNYVVKYNVRFRVRRDSAGKLFAERV